MKHFKLVKIKTEPCVTLIVLMLPGNAPKSSSVSILTRVPSHPLPLGRGYTPSWHPCSGKNKATPRYWQVGQLHHQSIICFSSAVLRCTSREPSGRAGFAQSGMAATGCGRTAQGISSIKEGHLPLQQHALRTIGNAGLGFPSIGACQGEFLTPLLSRECFSQQHNCPTRRKGTRRALSVSSSLQTQSLHLGQRVGGGDSVRPQVW